MLQAGEQWIYHNPVHITFGLGCSRLASSIVRGRTLLVTTAGAVRRGAVAQLQAELSEVTVYDGVESHPTIAAVTSAISELRSESFAWIISFGGGSVIDVGKTFGLALADRTVTLDQLLAGQAPLVTHPIPVLAIPTTAGTGSEVTPFATLWDNETGLKRSLDAPNLHPAAAVIDPELTVSVPWSVTVSTGLDTYCQCIEAVLNRRSTPITSALATRGIRLVPEALRQLRANPIDLTARAAMAEAALLSGLAISVTRTGLPHAMSYPLTAQLGIPHGLACALNLPAIVGFNAAGDRGDTDRLSRELGLRDGHHLVRVILGMYRELGVSDLIREYLPTPDAMWQLADQMLTPERADNNPRRVGRRELDALLARTAAWLEQGFSTDAVMHP